MSSQNSGNGPVFIAQQLNLLNASQTNGYPNQISVQFVNQQNFNDCEVALVKLSLYYSWANVKASYGNDSFGYILPGYTPNGFGTLGVQTSTTCTPGTELPFTVGPSSTPKLADGYYQIADLNALMQQVMYTNGHYLYNTTTSTNTYFLQFVVNTALYGVTVVSTPLPAHANAVGTTSPFTYLYNYVNDQQSSPTQEFTLGAGTASANMSLVVPATLYPAGAANNGLNSSVSKLLGIAPGTYTNTNSTFPPQLTMVNNFVVNCNLVNTFSFNSFSSYLYSDSAQGANYGGQILFSPPVLTWQPVADGAYNNITLSLVDGLNNPLQIQDPQWSAVVWIRKRPAALAAEQQQKRETKESEQYRKRLRH